MPFVSSLYEGELTAASARSSRRRHGAILLIDLDEAPRLPLARTLALAARGDLETELARAGLAHGGPIRALVLPGLTAYLCHAADGRLSAVRFDAGERTWLAPASSSDGVARLRAGPYSLRLRVTPETAQIGVDATNESGALDFAHAFMGRRRRLSAWSRARLVLARRRSASLAAPIATAVAAWCAEAPCSERRLAA